jgi:hypothetical protein
MSLRFRTTIGGASVLLFLACYSLPDSFPCAQDLSCPSGRACFLGECQKSRSCNTGEARIGENTVDRLYEVCARLCSDFSGCPAGLKCNPSFLKNEGYDSPASVCVECVADSDCAEQCCSYGRCIRRIDARAARCVSGVVADIDAGAQCDVVKQECANGKCVAFFESQNGDSENRCVEPSGTRGYGESCTRLAGAASGLDDCAKGLQCSTRGAPRGSLLCRQLCNVDSDCGAHPGEACFRLGATANSSRAGICTPVCSVFASACPTGTTCSPAIDPDETRVLPFCVTPAQPSADAGTRTIGMPCDSIDQCAAGLGCNSDGTGFQCLPWCDASHPCSAGNCVLVHPKAINGLGFCK